MREKEGVREIHSRERHKCIKENCGQLLTVATARILPAYSVNRMAYSGQKWIGPNL